MAQLLRQVIDSGAPPSLARLPMTPEEVAASYDNLEADEDEDEDGEDEGCREDDDRTGDGHADRAGDGDAAANDAALDG
jgi:hypothetical protein